MRNEGITLCAWRRGKKFGKKKVSKFHTIFIHFLRFHQILCILIEFEMESEKWVSLWVKNKINKLKTLGEKFSDKLSGVMLNFSALLFAWSTRVFHSAILRIYLPTGLFAWQNVAQTWHWIKSFSYQCDEFLKVEFAMRNSW